MNRQSHVLAITTQLPNRSQRVVGLDSEQAAGPQACIQAYFSKTSSTATCKICKPIHKSNKNTIAMKVHLKNYSLTLDDEQQLVN